MKVTSDNYVKLACRTEAPIDDSVSKRIVNKARLLHAAEGMCTESGEFIDMLKKHIYYGKKFDSVNAIEEIGDLLWYIAIACDELDVSIQQIMQINIDKLLARYPDKFSKEDAINRDLRKERALLENYELVEEDKK